MFNEEVMNKIMEKAQKDPEFKKVMEELLEWSQKAAHCKMSMEEIANICTTGFTIGSSPELQEMIGNMAKITKLGLGIVDK